MMIKMSVPAFSTIGVLLIDDEALLRAGLKMLLEDWPGLKVVGQAAGDSEALRLAEEAQPDVILFHESSGDPARLALLPQLMAVVNAPHIILLTPLTDSSYHVQAVHQGAMGVISSQNSPEMLYKAIEKVHLGEVWLDRSLVADVLRQRAAPQKEAAADSAMRRIASLSEREREIIALVGAGLKNQQIADQLFLSEVTVRHHLTSIFKKLNVSDRLELVIYAYKNNLAQLPQ